MNHNSLLQHYTILKTLKDLSNIIFLSDSNELPFRMKWDLLETDTDTYVLFSTKKSAHMQLVRISKATQAVHAIASFSIEPKSYNIQINKIYNGGTGFLFTGEENIMRFLEPGKKEVINLNALPQEAMRGLLGGAGIEELEFQYGTLHNFDGDSFAMYCIFSLLYYVDNICEKVKGEHFNGLSLLNIVSNEDDLDLLVSSLTVLKEKVQKDLDYA